MAGRRPLSLLKRLYERVLDLRRQGLSYRQIQERIMEEAGEKLSKSTISEWVNGIHTPYGDGLGRGGEDRRLNRIKPCPELAYVIGAALGDGSMKREKCKWESMVVLRVKDYDFAAEFGRCAAKAVSRQKPYRPFLDRGRQQWEAKMGSKMLCEPLEKPIDLERIKPYVDPS